ncbi:MAG: hypothetical protein ACOCMX_02405 [Acetivibrio ethanolgignens]
MIGLSKMAYNALRNENNSRIPSSPKELWKRSKLATIWLFLCLIIEMPLTALKYVLMALCFIPHAIYETLEN